ncbi:MAG: septum formation protein Maf [Planctomycetes bacterium]|nr:septum formation protein Maf [Planctomycetota bacterium]
MGPVDPALRFQTAQARSGVSARLILASTSPRRTKLLDEAGIAHRCIAPPFDDSHFDVSHLKVRQAVATLAHMKAASVAELLDAGLVLGADTLVSLDEHILGKPADADDARRMIGQLVGRTHAVLTGVCLIDAASGRERIFVDEAFVTIGPLDDAAIEAYIAGGQWQGKAGGYNLAELTDRWPITVEGDPATVVGLPMRRLGEWIDAFNASSSPSLEGGARGG